MRFNIVSVVSAVYLVSGTFAAPAGNPDGAKTVIGQLGSELPVQSAGGVNPLIIDTALTRNSQGATVPSTIPATTASDTGTSVGQESSDLKPQAAPIKIAGIIDGSNTDQGESDTDIPFLPTGKPPNHVFAPILQTLSLKEIIRLCDYPYYQQPNIFCEGQR